MTTLIRKLNNKLNSYDLMKQVLPIMVSSTLFAASLAFLLITFSSF